MKTETQISIERRILSPTNEDVLSDVYTALSEKDERIAYLEEQVRRLSGEHFKDKEIERLVFERKKMEDDYYRGFPISEKEMEAINKWKEKHYKGMRFGACGGGFTYQFLPTGIGTSGVIIGPDGKKFEFQELG